MRLELNKDNEIIDPNAVRNGTEETAGQTSNEAGKAADGKYQTLEQSLKEEQRKKFKELDFKGKLTFIWDYYKWAFIGGICVIVVLSVFIRDCRENLKPVYLDALMINSNFSFDTTNTLDSDYVSQIGFDTDEYNYYIDTSVNLSEDNFDTTMVAYQQKIVSMYAAGELDVVIGPKNIMEGSADCECYGNLSEILPQDLIDELIDRDYEFYYYDAKAIAERKAAEDPEYTDERSEDELPDTYFAGIYLDNCSYLNNNGEYGAYDLATEEDERPIFTIPANAPHTDHAVEFLRFLIENR